MSTSQQQQPEAPPTAGRDRQTPMQRFTDLCVRYVERLMPDPYLFAIILTLLVVVMVFVLRAGRDRGRRHSTAGTRGAGGPATSSRSPWRWC